MTFAPDSKFWHCRINANGRPYTVYNKTFAEINAQIIVPYLNGQRIYIDSKVINKIDDISNIRILKSDCTKENIQERIAQKAGLQALATGMSYNFPVEALARQAVLNQFATGVRDVWESLKSCSQDFTSELLATGKGQDLVNSKQIGANMSLNNSNATVFIVHGHDEALKQALARLLENQHLKATILDEQPGGGKTLIEKFEHYADQSSFAISLWTPDDLGKCDGDDELKKRARQNVIFETGYFCGKLGRSRVVILYSPDVEIPTDYIGVNYISTADGTWKYKLADEMKAAGLEIDKNSIK